MAVQIGGIDPILTKSYLPFGVIYDDNADRQGDASFANAIANGPAKVGTGVQYRGGVQLRDGRVVLCPSASPTIGVFDPVTSQMRAGVAHGGPSSRAFCGAILLPGELVLLIADFSDFFLVYDPNRDAIVATIPHGQARPSTSRAHFYTASIGRDNAVYCFHTVQRRMFRIDTMSYTIAPVGAAPEMTSAETAIPFSGSALMRDGRIMLLPRAEAAPLVFDTAKRLWAALAAPAATGSTIFNGGALGPDGKIYCPRGSGSGAPQVFDPISNSWTVLPTPAWITTTAFSGVRVLPGRKLAFIPANGAYFGVYDIATQTWLQGAEVGAAGTANIDGGIVLQDGRIFLIANAAANHMLYTPFTGAAPLPWAFNQSRFTGNMV
ncbi:hypothetical protein [Ketogulonicigenium vulgare]|uniref:hypothetical protein n=1 Tax=Ketogulonicigenium vulgare TaxID=92945 RepID=UPI002359383B|nr:hypothetical protein [Ketogulonicigenium vulgare]